MYPVVTLPNFIAYGALAHCVTLPSHQSGDGKDETPSQRESIGLRRHSTVHPFCHTQVEHPVIFQASAGTLKLVDGGLDNIWHKVAELRE
jgi:hypothetical protein